MDGEGVAMLHLDSTLPLRSGTAPGPYRLALASFAAWTACAAFSYLRVKRSTRPAVSSNFCLPVKKGWQFEQISTPISPLWVERVMNVFPQAQCTRTSL